MQAARDNLVRVGVSQFGAQLTEALLGGVAEHADRRPGNRVKRFVCGRQAVMNRARKFMIQDEKFDDLFRRDMAVALAVHF